MQKIAIVCFAALTLFACTNHGPFTVKGKLTHAPEQQWLYLEKVAFTGTGNVTVDSMKLTANGDYVLKGNDKEEDLFELSVDHRPFAIVINDNGAIELNADLSAENARLPQIIGSGATVRLYGFMQTCLHRDSAIRAISAQADTMASHAPIDSAAVEALLEQRLKQVKGINEEIKDIVATEPSPGLVCYALNVAQNTGAENIDTLVQAASARFKQHSTIALLKSLIAEAEAKQQSQDGGKPAPYPLLNQQAPDLSMTGIDGKTVSIKSFRGKYLLVDFWASWCGPCRAENPNVVKAWGMFKNKNFTILGVSLDKDKDSWQEAVQKDGLAWNQMSDLKYWESAAVDAYHFDGIPFNVLIDPTGKIIASELRGPALEAKLAEVLK